MENNTLELVQVSSPVVVVPFVLGENEQMVVEYQKNKDNRIANSIIENNSALIMSIVKKMGLTKRGCEVDEWMAEGRLAMFSAIKTYDVSTSKRFSTYAQHCIHNRFCQLIRGQANYTKRVTGYTGNLRQSSFVTNEETTNEDMPTISELIVASGLKESEIELLKHRYGFNNQEPKTLAEIGKIYNISHQRVDMMLRDIVAKMRAAAENL